MLPRFASWCRSISCISTVWCNTTNIMKLYKHWMKPTVCASQIVKGCGAPADWTGDHQSSFWVWVVHHRLGIPKLYLHNYKMSWIDSQQQQQQQKNPNENASSNKFFITAISRICWTGSSRRWGHWHPDACSHTTTRCLWHCSLSSLHPKHCYRRYLAQAARSGSDHPPQLWVSRAIHSPLEQHTGIRVATH